MNNRVPILLVEDDEVDVINVRRAFQENKITNPIQVVGNGEEALAFLRREGEFAGQTSEHRPGLVLLDLNMPRMGGLEFLKIIKQDDELKSIPVIVLSTSSEENDRIESFNLGVAGYIIKPVDFSKFLEAVRVISLYWSLCATP